MRNFFRQKNKSAGFTVVETLVALAIFSMAVVTVLTLLSQGISDTAYAKKKMTATYLVQEGTEYIRNMRDTYMLYDPGGPQIGWNSFLVKINPCDITSNPDKSCYFNPDNLNYSSDSQPMAAIPVNACGSSCPSLFYDSTTGKYNYSSSGIDSGFIRKVQATQVSANELKVVSTVYWTQGSGSYNITFSEDLFNWIGDDSQPAYSQSSYSYAQSSYAYAQSSYAPPSPVLTWTGTTSGNQDMSSNGNLFFTTPGTYSITVNTAMTLTFTGIAGGGGGAGGTNTGNTNAAAGGGGGGGAATTGTSVTFVSGKTYSLAVGAGGSGGSTADPGVSGGVGINTEIYNSTDAVYLFRLGGGNGGNAVAGVGGGGTGGGNVGGSNIVIGGNGGNGSINAGNGATNGTSSSSGGGGGGGSGYQANGAGGNGTSTSGGGGGVVGTPGGNGGGWTFNGTTCGGGGGGGYRGGNGAAGQQGCSKLTFVSAP